LNKIRKILSAEIWFSYKK